MYLIVGLGNPEEEYSKTRHNMGFNTINKIAKEYNIEVNKKKFDALYGEGFIENEKVILLKPQTYMNLSGKSIVQVVNFYKINYEDILVIHDDLDLKCGQYRFKFDSSAGGHNGIKSIIGSLGTQKFCHLKIGIGHETNRDIKDYVLGNLSKNEIFDLETEKYSEMIEYFIVNGIEKCMNNYNKKGE